MTHFKVTASSLNVRQVPSLDGAILGALAKDKIVEYLDTSQDQKWLKVSSGTLVGWSSRKYLAPFTRNDLLAPFDHIIQIASTSIIASYRWADRGIAPRGYTKGMALVFARVYCRLLEGKDSAVEMAKANTAKSSTDALSHYASQFYELGMSNDASGVDTLRHLFVLLLGLGMRESSGRWCEGRDRAAHNTTSDTAEAGLFQTSWNAHSAHPLLLQLFKDYQTDPVSFLDVFKEGIKVQPHDMENFGSGDGLKFQRMSKECPVFAAEFAAIGLRNCRSHWGPINRRQVELRIEADSMFLDVQRAIDSFDYCPAFR